MDIKLRNYNLEALDLTNRDHRYVINRLASLQAVKDYISSDFNQFVQMPERKDKVTSGASYFVKKNDEIIGMVGSKQLDSHGILELWMALNPSDSGHGHGTKVLEEITPYLIENINGLNDIKFYINKNNIPSKKAAKKAGYTHVSTDIDGIETYKYFGK